MDALITYYIEISTYKSLTDIYIAQHKKVVEAARNTNVYKKDMIKKMEEEGQQLEHKNNVLKSIVEELDKILVFEKTEEKQ